MVLRRKLPSPSAARIPLNGTVTWSTPQGEDRGIRGRTGPGTRSADRVRAGSSRGPDDRCAARRRLAYLFGRAKVLNDVTGVRCAGWGHLVSAMIARVYGQAGREAA